MANFTTVSGTVTDPHGQVLSGATLNITFVPPTGVAQLALLAGSVFQRDYTVKLDSAGAFSVVLPDNTAITPPSSQWQFTVVPASDPTKSFSVAATISGTSQDVSSTLNGSAVALSTAAAGLGTYTATNASATPGTVRSLIGKMTDNAGLTSGNLVGARGEVTLAATKTSAGGFLYGAQGKFICNGSMVGSAWNFGLVGQLDVSAATLTSGSHIAPLWGDFGTTGPAVSASFANLLVLTNTTATTLGSHIYTYGKAAVVFDISANGSACTDASSTAAGSVIGHILVNLDGVAGVLRVYNGS